MTENAALRYQTIYNRLRISAGIQIAALWLKFGGLDDEAAERFTKAAVAQMNGATAAVARLNIAYLLTAARQAGVDVPDPNVDIRTVTGKALRGVDPTDVYLRPIVTARTAIANGRTFDEAMQLGRDRAVNLAETDIALTQRATTTAVLPKTKAVGYRRTLTGASCALCATAATQRYHSSQLMPLHSHCIPAGSVVSVPPSTNADTAVLAVTRRWYVGELVIIRTAAGDDVTVTPNHPVLTDQGWRPAGLVREGDHLLRYLSAHRAIHGRPQKHDRPTPIQDVWGANAVAGLVSVPLAAEDFHGDGTDGEVEIVWADRNLTSELNSQLVEPTSEELLGLRHDGWSEFAGSGTLALLAPRMLTAANSSVSGVDLGAAFCLAHLRSTQQPSGTSAARYDAPTEQFSLQSVAVYTSKGMDLVRRLASEVEPDRIVHARRVSFSDHVYNLYTDEGWYSSNNHIVSNCDCGVAPIFGTSDPGRVINSKLLEELKTSGRAGELAQSQAISNANKTVESANTRIAAIDKQLAAEKPGSRRDQLAGQRADLVARKTAAENKIVERRQTLAEFRKQHTFSDTVTVHQHGELGPVLTRAGDHFTNEVEALH